MRVLITGGAGFLGQKLARELVARGQVGGREITAIELIDVTPPAAPAADFPVLAHARDITDPQALAESFGHKPEIVWHLAAVVSAAAEADLDLGLKVNLGGTLNLLQAARAAGNCPVFVFASSVAAHGGEEPELVPDGVELNPQTSYGTQKVMGELLLNDFTRRGLVDGRGLRLPTVTIRPGRPNAAASSFMSSIFRDTMQGRKANCPVRPDYPIWHSAPRTVVHNLIYAAEIGGESIGSNRNFNLTGRTDTVAEMIAAMTEVFGPEAEKRITWERDPQIERIVTGWRGHFRPEKARRLGFRTDRSFADTVRWFLEDDIVR